MAKKKKDNKNQLISFGSVAQNRKARFNYFVEEKLEVGVVLKGTEVKCLRLGRGNIQEAFAGPQNDELYLFNAYIPEYENGGYARHEPRRPRKLLLHRREINRLLGAVQQGGMTLVPLGIYFNNRGVAKVDLGLCRGKKNVDKRETIKQRDWNREKHRLLKNG